MSCCWPAETVRSQFPSISACSRRPGEPRYATSSSSPLSDASAESQIALTREHHEIDEEIRKGPADWTLLRPHLYMQISVPRRRCADVAGVDQRKTVAPPSELQAVLRAEPPPTPSGGQLRRNQ
jgi:hypothetical protein